jgi:hypothetical protein
VRDIRSIKPALIAELFDGERQQFLIDLEAEVICLRAAGEMPCGIC